MPRREIHIGNSVRLPDGSQASDLRRDALFRKLTDLGIPGISSNMAKQELLAVYEAAVLAKAEAIARANFASEVNNIDDQTKVPG